MKTRKTEIWKREPLSGDRDLFRMAPREHVQTLALVHTKKVQGVMQIRQTRQMQINEDACVLQIEPTRLPHLKLNLSAPTVIFNDTYSKTLEYVAIERWCA